VTSDEHEGLKSAIERHFRGASHQRCQFYYAENLLGMVSFEKRKELAAGLRAVFVAPARELALRVAEELADRWRESYPKVPQYLEEHIEECLACLSFPESHRRRTLTTNGLERLNQELKRRTRVVRIFPDREFCLRPGVGACSRAVRGVANRQALPGHEGAEAGALARAGRRGGGLHEAMSKLSSWGSYRRIGT
jgi:transposase-like protein